MALFRLLIMCACVPRIDTSTNGTLFYFTTPQYMKEWNSVRLAIVTFDILNSIEITHFTASGEVTAKQVVQMDYNFMVVDLPNSFYSTQGEGDKGTTVIQTKVTVHINLYIFNKKKLSALAKLLPYNVWGTVYYVLTLNMNPVILITSGSKDNVVEVDLRFSPNHRIRLPNLMATLGKENVRYVMLNQGQSYSISQCEPKKADNPDDIGSLTGTKIKGDKPIFVMTGSCHALTTTYTCGSTKTVGNSKKFDIALDTAIPMEYSGTEYVTFATNFLRPEEKSPDGNIVVIASKPDTVVEYSLSSSRTIELAGDYIYLDNESPHCIKTSKPVVVYYVMLPSCEGQGIKGQNMPSITPIVANDFFSNYYTVRTLEPDPVLYYVLVYSLEGDPKVVTATSSDSDVLHKRKIVGKSKWQTGAVVEKNDFYSFIHLSDWSKFGCYVMQLGENYASITFADFNVPSATVQEATTTQESTTTVLPTTTTTFESTTTPPPTTPILTPKPVPKPTEPFTTAKSTTPATPKTMRSTTLPQPTTLVKCVLLTTEMKPNDGVDNDCDGFVDEETRDGIDNDSDGLIDEDVYALPIDGQWAVWDEWLCTEDCKSSNLSRRRLCDAPTPAMGGRECEGHDYEITKGNCYQSNLTCPTECGPNQWYEGCTRSCESCSGDCNKFNGSCTTCQPGYRNAKRGCKQQCDSFTYGLDCSLSCKEKCGSICAEPVHGKCPQVSLLPVFLMLIFVVLPCCVLICIPKSGNKKKRQVSESHTCTTSAATTHTGEFHSSYESDSLSSSSSSSGDEVDPSRDADLKSLYAVLSSPTSALATKQHLHHHHHHHRHSTHTHLGRKKPKAPKRTPDSGSTDDSV